MRRQYKTVDQLRILRIIAINTQFAFSGIFCWRPDAYQNFAFLFFLFLTTIIPHFHHAKVKIRNWYKGITDVTWFYMMLYLLVYIDVLYNLIRYF